MKMKRSTIASQVLILILAVCVLLVMAQVARAQSSMDLPPASSMGLFQPKTTSSSNSNQGSFQNQSNNSNQNAQILQVDMPQKNLARRLWENTTLGYYQQFLGPTAAGPGSETYNVFQEGIDSPNSGRAPLQSFHAVNLRHQINSNWAVGATLSAVNGYTKTVQNVDKDGYTFDNTPRTDFFNARAYVGLPPMRFKYGTLFTTVSYEAPTSSISKEQEMRYGWVLSQSYALALSDVRWNAGLTGQIYRMYYDNNVTGGDFPISYQTMIVSAGPYVNYRINDFWMVGSVITLDWDQRGLQSGSRDFNNNLPHRGRVNLTYFPQQIKYLQSVGLFTQALLKYRHDTTAFGADFTVRF